jgi:hypothetical protein
MYKVTIDHLEQVKKALIKSNDAIEKIAPKSMHDLEWDKNHKIVESNKKTIKMIDDEYLNRKG